jgi:hypothetical protein
MQYGRSLGRSQVLNPFDGGADATGRKWPLSPFRHDGAAVRDTADM